VRVALAFVASVERAVADSAEAPKWPPRSISGRSAHGGGHLGHVGPRPALGGRAAVRRGKACDIYGGSKLRPIPELVRRVVRVRWNSKLPP